MPPLRKNHSQNSKLERDLEEGWKEKGKVRAKQRLWLQHLLEPVKQIKMIALMDKSAFLDIHKMSRTRMLLHTKMPLMLIQLLKKEEKFLHATIQVRHPN